jgi:hypothetical protein
MHIKRDETKLYKVIDVAVDDEPFASRVTVLTQVGDDLKTWAAPTLRWGGHDGVPVEFARRYAEVLLEACRIAEEIAGQSGASRGG